jgi:hypothetical protein
MKNIILAKAQDDWLKEAIANGVTTVKEQVKPKERKLPTPELTEQTRADILRLYRLDWNLTTIGYHLKVPYYFIYETIYQCTL